jgi:hypothetical protein
MDYPKELESDFTSLEEDGYVPYASDPTWDVVSPRIVSELNGYGWSDDLRTNIQLATTKRATNDPESDAGGSGLSTTKPVPKSAHRMEMHHIGASVNYVEEEQQHGDYDGSSPPTALTAVRGIQSNINSIYEGRRNDIKIAPSTGIIATIMDPIPPMHPSSLFVPGSEKSWPARTNDLTMHAFGDTLEREGAVEWEDIEVHAE